MLGRKSGFGLAVAACAALALWSGAQGYAADRMVLGEYFTATW